MEIKVVKSVLEKNRKLADEVRVLLSKNTQTMINFMSSPGAGKTRLLETLIPALQKRGLKVGVIEGDVTTSFDADRLKTLGIPISLINTEKFGGTCHLGANVVLAALQLLNDPNLDMIIVENVGNLICPAEYDTGAHANVVLISVAEGEDKPLKYPAIFRKCELALINKVDIASVLEVDLSLIRKNIRSVHPSSFILETSGKKGIGIDELVAWIENLHAKQKLS